MAANYWLKLYYEMLDDPKIGQLRPALRWRFVECLLVAGECDEGGYLPAPAQYAWRVRDIGGPDHVETDFAQLAEAGLLSQDGGQWLVTKFAERQAPVSGAERVARYRQRKRKQEYYEGVTEQSRDSNEAVTKRYTDTDKIRIDTDTDAVLDVPAVLKTKPFDTAWKRWCAHIEEKGLTLTREQVNLELARLGEMGHDEAIEAIRHSIRKGWKGIYPPSENGFSGGSARGKAAGQLVLNHIKTHGARRKLNADEATLEAVKAAGGLGKLGKMSERDVISAIAASYKEPVTI